MHEIRLDEQFDGKALVSAVVQITQLLGLYQAETARILGLQCGDIGQLNTGKFLIEPGTPLWAKATAFVSLYEQLYRYKDGNAVDIYHWLRATNPDLGGEPLLLLVDEGKLHEVVAWLIAKN